MDDLNFIKDLEFIDVPLMSDVWNDLFERARDPEWLEIHRQMGFDTPAADVLLMENMNKPEEDGDARS